MLTTPTDTDEVVERRRQAEKRLREQRPGPDQTDTEMRKLVHELQVHQIELEMQNEELQHARDAVEAGLEKYSDLYEFAPVAYLTLDHAGTIQGANLTASSLLGIGRSRLLKSRFGHRVAPADLPAWNRFLKQVFESKDRHFCEVTLHREGKTPVAVRIEAALATSRRECRAAVIDMTERKRVEIDRLILSKLESTGILAGGIAHDFNNLLTVMLLNLELARTLSPPVGELSHHLEDARKAVLLARGLTQQLITFAKGGAANRKPTHLSGVIEEAVRLALSGSRVRCDLSLADDLWVVEVDEGQIGQVIRNMVLNAREAMPTGGSISVRAENAVLASHDEPSLPAGDYLRVSIADRGNGIPKEVLPMVFDPYFSTKQRGDQKGMGLGLTICHTVIRRHGGAIAVKSEEAKGTTFEIYLPACRILLEKPRASVETPLPRPGKILVMDDEEEVREVMGALLRRMGQDVILVENGERAVEAYEAAMGQERPFDAVILDLTVRAGLGGQEAMQALLKADPAIKAIVMSGYADDPVLLEPEKHGFRGILRKPFESDSLRKALARVMGAVKREM
jgi:two-component system, cell cycle sensor histidine kinase and response regulator CckA